MESNFKNIKNVVLLGHSGCGKTSFAETMLFESQAISRMGSVLEKNTVSDYTNIEKERGNSIFSTLMHAVWKDSKINIMDTPGYDDFVGEVISSLKVADTALLLINTAHGVEVGTELIWEHIEKYQTPSILVFNQIDHEKADFDSTLEQAVQRFGPKLIPFQYPIKTDHLAIVDALRMVMYEFDSNGGKPTKKEIPANELARAKEMHNKIVEAAAENEEGLMEKYFEAGTLTEEELTMGLKIALAHQQIFPIFCCSATKNSGSGRIMGFINDIAPSPWECPPAKLTDGQTLACDPNDPNTRIFIFKTITEPQVGLVSYFKVYAGTLQTGADLHNLDKQNSERLGQIFVAEGKNRFPITKLQAGDIGVAVKLKDTHTNNTLATKAQSAKITPIEFPEPRIRTAIVPPGKSDMEKLIRVLHQIEEEDPTIKVEQNAQLKQTILYGQGQLHLDIIKYRIEKVHNLHLQFERPKIPYRETITRMAEESYRHKKQSGGSGQFAEVHMRIEPFEEGMPDPAGLTVKNREVEPLEWGGSLAFYWCIVGGSIDAKYANAIKKGIMQKMQNGPLSGSHCQNIRVSVYDGKMHSVDSNDMAFMLAASNCFRQAFEKAHPQLLEPIYDVEIICPDAVMGDIMSDLQTRRAIIQGMDTAGHYQKIKAKVPLMELYQYSSTLRSISQGIAKHSRAFSHYAPLPAELQAKIAAEHTTEDHE